MVIALAERLLHQTYFLHEDAHLFIALGHEFSILCSGLPQDSKSAILHKLLELGTGHGLLQGFFKDLYDIIRRILGNTNAAPGSQGVIECPIL